MVEKRETGFRFGKYGLEVIASLGSCEYGGRTYRLVRVRTSDGKIYLSLRLYNGSGRFIKQFLFEPEVREKLAEILLQAGDSGSKKVM
jgi:hypothetical protein